MLIEALFKIPIIYYQTCCILGRNIRKMRGKFDYSFKRFFKRLFANIDILVQIKILVFVKMLVIGR